MERLGLEGVHDKTKYKKFTNGINYLYEIYEDIIEREQRIQNYVKNKNILIKLEKIR